MLEKVIYIFRNIYIRIISRGRVTIPFHSRISDRTEFYTNNGTIKAGVGFVTSSNSVFSALDGGTMTIGERVFVNRNCIFVCRKDIRIGNHCSFGPNVCIYDHDHKYGYHGPVQGYKYGKVIIEDHCWIGANVTVLRGSHIGECCIIGAGCIVKGYIPPHSLVTMDNTLKIREITNAQVS